MKWPDDFIGKVIQGDCLDVMREMPDKCVDLVLTDPPYGIGEAAGKNRNRGTIRAPSTDFGNEEWDDKRPSLEEFKEILRISRNQIIFGGNYFADLLPPSNCWIVWDKKINGDFADCELAWTSFDSAVRMVSYTWNGFLQGDMKHKEFRQHPTQKPLPVFRWCLEKYSKYISPGGIVFDPYAGVGTTAMACDLLQFNWSLVEKEKKYCDIARKRIDTEKSQGKLF